MAVARFDTGALPSTADAFWLLRCVLMTAVLLCPLVVAGGCKEKPAPPAAAPPPPPPPELGEAEVGELLRAHFFALFNRAFNPIMAYENRYQLGYLSGGANGGGEELAVAIADAKASTPSGKTLFDVPGNPDAGPFARYIEERSAEDVRKQVLRVYWLQGLEDAKRCNFHRAHVLLRDTVNEVARGMTTEVDGRFVNFFVDVPDAARIAAFGRLLERYLLEQVKLVTLKGDHASVLLSTESYKDSGRFIVDELLNQLELVSLPLVRQAIVRGEGYGFRPSEKLLTAEKMLVGLANTLKDSRPDNTDGSVRKEALKPSNDPRYSERLGEFERMFQNPAGGGRDDSASISRRVEELWGASRDIGSWMREKRICFENCELFVTQPGVHAIKPDLVCPVVWDAANESIASRFGSHFNEAAAQAIVEWCGDENRPFPVDVASGERVMDDGSAHFILGWYFLENPGNDAVTSSRSNPVAARRVLLHGATMLLEAARSADREAMLRSGRRGRDEVCRSLLMELNGIKLLIAAVAMGVAPPGATVSRGSYLSELEVLLFAWRQAWLSAGLPEQAARSTLDNCRTMIASVRVASRGPVDAENRYFFPDYRFRHGDVPDVVVAAAMERKMFLHDGQTVKTQEAAPGKAPFPLVNWLHEVVEGERGFSKETIARLKKSGQP